MGRRRKFGRRLDGVLLINKPQGVTSNAILQTAKRLFFANKAGHTGALDPLATGVLPLCFGEATKFSQYLLDADKIYRSTFELGVTSATADSDGEILQTNRAGHITQADVEAQLPSFRGPIDQVPPMYSALKKDGQPLYKLARQGIEVERKARSVTILEYTLLSFTAAGDHPLVEMRIHCTKGTYIRSLAADLGEALGVGARVVALHREQAGPFAERSALCIDELTEERGEDRAETLDYHLLPMDAPVAGLPKVILDDNSGFYFGQGQPVMENGVYQIGDEGDTVRVFQESGRFLGLAEITDDSCVAPKRLVVYES